MTRRFFLPLLLVSLLENPLPGGPLPVWEGPAGPAGVAEGEWLLYQGTLKSSARRPGEETEEVSASIEAAYLGLGADGVLLLRSGESPENRELAASEAVSLVMGPGGEVRPRYHLEDRAFRVSPLLFKHLPLWILPPPVDLEPRQWKDTARLHVLNAGPRELRSSHRIEAGAGMERRYTIEVEPGQKVSVVREGREVPFEVKSLRQVFRLAPPGPGAAFRLEGFESTVEGRFPPVGPAGDPAGGPAGDPGSDPAGDKAEIASARVELTLREGRQKAEESRWSALRSEARLVQEIEKALFEDLSPDTAESKASVFRRERGDSRLARFAEGLALQADLVRPIARERKLYGKPAPDFTLRDLSGKEVTFSRILPGKVTLLSFWSVG